MSSNTRARCPNCDTEADVKLADANGLVDSVVKATSEEVVMEIGCKEPDCTAVWRAVYTFTGNN